ncbi:hypothetical protein AAG906_035796 [Vitis piasezkii]
MNAIIPYETGHPPIRSYRLRQHATPFNHHTWYNLKQVLAYALDDTRDESQILCSMHNFFLTRFDLKCLGPDKLVYNKVVTMHCQILNGMDKGNRKHSLSPNFVSDVENKRGSLSPKYICDNLWKYFKNTRLCTYEQLFIPICRKNHWYLIILNIHAKRIELLDSLIDGRKKRMDAFIEKLVNVLSTVIGIQERRPSVDMTEFEFVVPEVTRS